MRLAPINASPDGDMSDGGGASDAGGPSGGNGTARAGFGRDALRPVATGAVFGTSITGPAAATALLIALTSVSASARGMVSPSVLLPPS